jgi:LysM repeat protein
MRFHLISFPGLFLALILCGSATPSLRAQNPGAQQDAEAAREKLLKAADQLDNIQANSEATKLSVDGMKTDITKLQASITQLETENATLKQQLADTQTALDQFKAEQLKARQTLIDNVADMLAAKKGTDSSKPAKKKKEPALEEDAGAAPETSSPVKKTNTEVHTSSLAPPPDSNSLSSNGAGSGDTASAEESAPAPVKPHKGYYHVVASGETLALICSAYRDNGVKVTVSEIRKANGLTEDSVLKVGQKLFIPKPGN